MNRSPFRPLPMASLFLAIFALVFVLALACEKNTTTITEVPFTPPEEEEACQLPEVAPASLVPQQPTACQGNRCAANRVIAQSVPDFVTARWSTPGAFQSEYQGVSGVVEYPFTTEEVTHSWNVVACTDLAGQCCAPNNGSVVFNAQ